jgi:hypothetical protein
MDPERSESRSIRRARRNRVDASWLTLVPDSRRLVAATAPFALSVLTPRRSGD